MNNRKLAFIHSPDIEAFTYPPDCPFRTQRAARLRERLASFQLLTGEDRAVVAPRPATRAELEKFHTARYLDELQRAAAGDLTVVGFGMGLGGPETHVSRDVYEYPRWACGATLTGAQLILSGDADIVFNPSGGFHHAGAEKASGFCYLNDMVLGCQRLADAGKRVLCLDLDAHHGDGTQEAFYDRNDVMTISMHESGKTLFPWGGFEDEIGEGTGRGYNVNVPLPAYTYDEAFLFALNRISVPLIGAFNPDVLVVEFGMDTLAGDPLTHLALTNNVYPEIVHRLLSFGKPILATGGGGYNVGNTVRGWALVWQTFCGEEDENDLGVGMGGVMLQSTEWLGGLHDRELPVSAEQRAAVEPVVRETTQRIRQTVFPLHELPADS
ncbi:MAG: acetoin utilization protein AcuC [Verrucomicrobiia bacterium]|jgi:acetoin utilization protein AcuC